MTTRSKGPTNPNTGNSIRLKYNWPSECCKQFGRIISVPVLRNRYLLKAALRIALSKRIRKEKSEQRGLQDSLDLEDMAGVEDMSNEIARRIPELSEDQTNIIQSVILTGFIRKHGATPDHWELLKYLDKVVRKGYSCKEDDLCKPQSCDLKAIEDAWDLYVEKEAVHLSKVEACSKLASKSYPRGFIRADNKNYRNEEFFRAKKAFIFHDRRKEERKKNELAAASSHADHNSAAGSVKAEDGQYQSRRHHSVLNEEQHLALHEDGRAHTPVPRHHSRSLSVTHSANDNNDESDGMDDDEYLP